MESSHSYDAMPHQAVVSNLLDLQARLRGDPASMVVPRMRPQASPDPVVVGHDDIAVTESPAASRGESTDPLLVEAEDAEGRIEALRRRLQYLELEIDAYESAVSALPVEDNRSIGEGNVIDLQQAVEQRLTQD